jgi:NitT/TauT family transport system substrate-binding protein
MILITGAKNMKKLLVTLALACTATLSMAEESVKIGWSHYTGWEPMGYIQESGLMDKYNKIHGTNVEMVYIGDYIDSLTLYTAKQLNGVTVTTMDVMAIPAVGGRHSTSIVVGDYSDGNDGVVLKGYNTLEDADGASVNLVEYSVSHYLFAQCLAKRGLDIDDYELVNTTDADIPGVVKQGQKVVAVSWNPMLSTIKNEGESKVVCSSSDIKGEILDMIVVGDEVSDKARQAIADAWYEAIGLMQAGNQETMAALAEQAGSSVRDFNSQLKTTAMFYTPAEAKSFVMQDELKSVMEKVITFSFNNGVYDGVDKVDELGVKFPDGSVWGSKSNVGLTFSTKYYK